MFGADRNKVVSSPKVMPAILSVIPETEFRAMLPFTVKVGPSGRYPISDRLPPTMKLPPVLNVEAASSVSRNMLVSLPKVIPATRFTVSRLMLPVTV